MRDLTRSPVAAFVAGLAFAFAPYRLAQFSHLQVLSAQWMPFVLYGFRRYFETGRRAPLIGGTAALVLQNLSCGYYLLFFAPFVGLYVFVRNGLAWPAARLADVAHVGGGRCDRARLHLSLSGSVFDVRKSGDVGVPRRRRDRHVLGRHPRVCHTVGLVVVCGPSGCTGLPRPEGEGFPGLAILLLAVVGVLVGASHAVRWATEPGIARRSPVASGACGRCWRCCWSRT